MLAELDADPAWVGVYYGIAAAASLVAASLQKKKRGSHLTRRWRETDSTLPFPVREVVISAFPKWTGSR